MRWKWFCKKDEMIFVILGVAVLQFCLLAGAFMIPVDKFVLPYLIISVYCFLYLIHIKIYRYCMRVVGFFLTLLTFIRYLVIPCMILMDENYMEYTPLERGANALYFQKGCWMMLWEALLVGLFLAYVLPKWYRKEEISKEIVFKKNSVLWLAMGALSVFVLLSPAVLSEYNLVIRLAGEELHKEAVNPGMLYTIALLSVRILKLLLPIPFVQFFYSKYKKTGKLRFYLASALVLGFFYAVIMEGNSRNSVVIPAVAVLMILYYLYPKYRKLTLFACCGGILSIVVVTLIWKSFSGNANVAASTPFSYWVSYVEQYFAGISNLGRTVIAKATYGKWFDLKMLVNDFFKAVPIASNYVKPEDTSSYYFLQVWGRNDQVIPATGNGMFYFGYVLAPMVPILIITLACFFEKKLQTAKSIPEIIVYIYASAVISYNMFNAVNSLGMKLIIYVLPLSLIIWANKKFQLRKMI